MKSKVLSTFDEAVRDIPDGATIMFGDFGGLGAPQNLIAALHRQGATGLTAISNEHGGTDGRVDVGTLIEAGQVSRMVCSITAPTHPSRVTPFVRLYNAGAVEAELAPQGTLAERIRAGGAGIGAFFTPTGVGTEISEGKESPRGLAEESTCWSFPCGRTMRLCGPGRPTLSEICASGWPSETSTR